MLSGCSPADDRSPRPSNDSGAALPWEATTLGPTPAPVDNPTTDDKVALGRLLFYDPIVSVDRSVACATCHSEVWGLSDGLPRSVGLGGGPIAGPGRMGSNLTLRNAQTLWNVAYRGSLFWDGRATSLEDQVRFPFESSIELDRDPGTVADDLRTIPEYRELFEAAFPESPQPVTAENLTRALATFQRTLVSDGSLYDSYVRGDRGALSAEMVEGMFLFEELGCSSCHVPPLFASEAFADRGIPSADGVEDQGRYDVTHDPEDVGRFAVPTLRNARDTGPYFHSGAVPSLAEAIRLEVAYSSEHDGSRAISPRESEALTLFIEKALVDRSAEPDRPETVPSGHPVPRDDTRILR